MLIDHSAFSSTKAPVTAFSLEHSNTWMETAIKLQINWALWVKPNESPTFMSTNTPSCHIKHRHRCSKLVNSSNPLKIRVTLFSHSALSMSGKYTWKRGERILIKPWSFTTGIKIFQATLICMDTLDAWIDTADFYWILQAPHDWNGLEV